MGNSSNGRCKSLRNTFTQEQVLDEQIKEIDQHLDALKKDEEALEQEMRQSQRRFNTALGLWFVLLVVWGLSMAYEFVAKFFEKEG